MEPGLHVTLFDISYVLIVRIKQAVCITEVLHHDCLYNGQLQLLIIKLRNTVIAFVVHWSAKIHNIQYMGRAERICVLEHMRTAKV